jgi:hypothetical protein
MLIAGVLFPQLVTKISVAQQIEFGQFAGHHQHNDQTV